MGFIPGTVSSWGYERIADVLGNLGHQLSDHTVGNILQRYGIPPAPRRTQGTSWMECLLFVIKQSRET